MINFALVKSCNSIVEIKLKYCKVYVFYESIKWKLTFDYWLIIRESPISSQMSKSIPNSIESRNSISIISDKIVVEIDLGEVAGSN